MNVIKIGDAALPGDTIKEFETHKGSVILGPGLRRHPTENIITITRAGVLKNRPPNTYWISSAPKHYIPKKSDLVVGVVSAKRGDTLRVDIGASELASLSLFAFEGATKKQKPDAQIGDVVYARLLNASREMEPELVCIDSYFKAGRLGLLSNDGFVFDVDLNLVERLLVFDNALLKALSRNIAFEIAIGMNGKVWVNARNAKDVNTIYTALRTASKQSDQDVAEICYR